ncbi:MAG TPA: zinc-finger domain-containing protein [Aliidongia sp.]|nr:zinc-finger domain-containing protein [Aliidongia sp.]
MSSSYPKFQNDRAAAEIRIGVKEFHCVGMSPPHDHPHVYINMGDRDVILCPYCATPFRFDSQLGPFMAAPLDSRYVES